VLDAHDVCIRQYRKRRQFYKQCAYKIKMIKGGADVADGPMDDDDGPTKKEEKLPAGPLFRS
jgi:hypothetical protein